MKKIFKAFVLPVLLLAAVSGACAAEEPVAVEALPDQTTVTLGMMFLVKTRVINSSEGSTDFWANTCSFEKQWVTDQEGIFIQAWTCNENGLEQIDLGPEEVYEKNLILYIPKQEKSGPVKFRLGFKRMDDTGDMTEPVWGDPVTIHVIVPEGTAPAAATPAREEPPKKSSQPVDSPPRIYTDPKEPIQVKPGKTFMISLASNPSTGYGWKMEFPEEEKILTLLDSKHVISSEPMPGAPGKQTYTFRALKAGQTKVRLVYQRPWIPSSADTREIFTVIVQGD